MNINEFGNNSFVRVKGLTERIREAEKEIQMRQYRAKSKDKDERWIYGWYSYNSRRNIHMITEENTGTWEVIPETVGQFTGLKDKKRTEEYPEGQEIYEGDLLRIPAKDKWEETNYSAFEVFFHDNDCADRHIGFQMNRMHNYGAVVGGCCKYPFLPKTTAKFEIIGDIHTTPKLLEQENA